jgi:serine/threonine protein kinase
MILDTLDAIRDISYKKFKDVIEEFDFLEYNIMGKDVCKEYFENLRNDAKFLSSGQYGEVYKIRLMDKNNKNIVVKQSHLNVEIYNITEPLKEMKRKNNVTYEHYKNDKKRLLKDLIDHIVDEKLLKTVKERREDLKTRDVDIPVENFSPKLAQRYKDYIYEMNVDDFIKNIGDGNRPSSLAYILIVDSPLLFVIEKDFVIPNLVEGKKGITLNKGDAFGSQSIYMEYIINLMIDETEKTTRSKNLLSAVSFASCYKNDRALIFMNMIDGSMDSILENTEKLKFKIGSLYIDNVIIQLLCGIDSYKSVFLINHNDLHFGNVFYQSISNSPLENLHNVPIGECYYGMYKIGDGGWVCLPFKDLYEKYDKRDIPILKIADWGLSCKYNVNRYGDTTRKNTSTPQILIREVMDGELFYEGEGEDDYFYMPNEFSPTFDMIHALFALWYMGLEKSRLQCKIMCLILGVRFEEDMKKTIKNINVEFKKYYVEEIHRPNIDMFIFDEREELRPYNILSNKKIMEGYIKDKNQFEDMDKRRMIDMGTIKMKKY